jgi:hypothetical protein
MADYDEEQFPAFLRLMAKYFGSVSAMARRFGVAASHLNKACLGKLPPSRRLLTLIGAIEKRVYEVPWVKNNPK